MSSGLNVLRGLDLRTFPSASSAPRIYTPQNWKLIGYFKRWDLLIIANMESIYL